MAITLTKKPSFLLSVAVSNRMSAFKQARSEAQLNAEMEFFKQVNEKGMSFEDQLSFRQGQLAQEQDREVPDQEYILSLKKEVSTLKKTLTQQRFKDAYLQSFTDLRTGHESIDDHIKFLQDQLNATEDPEQKSLINGYLSDAKQEQYNTETQISDNYYQYALNDKTIPILDKAISDAKKEQAKALGGGDKLRASALDMKIQSLSKTLNEVKIDNSMHEFALRKLKSYDPNSLLDTINDKIKGADASTPVTIDGQRYNSAKEFWETYQGQYFNSGEFDKALTNYYNDRFQIAYNESAAAYPVRLAQAKTELDTLMNRPDLAPYRAVIQGSVAGLLSKATDVAANDIIESSMIKYNFQDAINRLSKLQADTGVDQSSAYNKLINQISNVKSQEVQAFLSIVQARIAAGKSPQQALTEATGLYNQGKLGTQPSPEQTATGAVPDIGAKATLGTGSPDTRTSVQTPANLATYTEGQLLKDPSNPTVYRYESGKLRPIAMAPGATETQLKATVGGGWADIKTIPNLASANLPQGDIIQVQAPPKIVTTKTGQQFGNYAPQTLFVQEGNKLRPITSYEKYTQNFPNIKPEQVDLNYFADKQIGENF